MPVRWIGNGVKAAQRLGFALFTLLFAAIVQAQSTVCTGYNWPHWDEFVNRFLQEDGRVIDSSTPEQLTTSEGQSYGMFFALVANDRVTFDLLWRWSLSNLMDSPTKNRLPAWAWGKRDDGSWGVLDDNAASDADLWYAYALLEAGRLWRRPDYTRDAQALLAQIKAQEVVDLPGVGAMVLPGPFGFVQPDGLWRLNPSYLPVPLLRRLAQADPNGPWAAVVDHTVQMIQASTPHGFVADWIAYQATPDTTPETGRFDLDTVYGARGSYDAIRNYLWAGMTPAKDPAAKPLQQALYGMSDALTQRAWPPESVQVDTGQMQGDGPVGFSAALLPYLQARGQTPLLAVQLQRVRAALAPEAASQQTVRYYDYVLSLFGLGWFEQRYEFADSGRLILDWEKKCP
jgi:endo-1,4-beta-D-glucanase Y